MTLGREHIRLPAVSLALLFVFLSLNFVPTTAVNAANFTVNTTADTNDADPGDGVCADSGGTCSLRAAIQEANALTGADTITVPSGTYVTPDLPFVTDDLTIRGAGAKLTTLDGGGGLTAALVLRDFYNTVPTDVTIQDLSIRNARRGIQSNTLVSLTLNDVAVQGFSLTGIEVESGELVMDRGAIHGGGIYGITLNKRVASPGPESTAFITNVTISGMRWGIQVNNTQADATRFAHLTITGNSYGLGVAAAEVASVGNSIIAGNTTLDCSLQTTVPGVVDSLGYNLDSDDTCTFTAASDLPSTDPLLGPLADNGGSTPTHALSPGSPAIDAGPPGSCLDALGATLSTDQRGVIKPLGAGCDSGAFEYDNVGPFTSHVVASPNPASVGASITLNASVDDTATGFSTIASAEYDLDGGPSSPMVAVDLAFDEVREDVTAQIGPFEAPTVLKVCVRGVDAIGNVGPEECTFLAVYDLEEGFVTGGGWIDSPAGAYAPDPSLIGRANFGFVSRYKRGADVPGGQTEFQFRVADMNFHSGSYEWLVIAGPAAKFKGTGTINGEGDYGFMVTATDAELTASTEADLFRIKIWDKGDGDAIVYDNVMGEADDSDAGTELSGGSIVIHKGS